MQHPTASDFQRSPIVHRHLATFLKQRFARAVVLAVFFLRDVDVIKIVCADAHVERHRACTREGGLETRDGITVLEAVGPARVPGSFTSSDSCYTDAGP